LENKLNMVNIRLTSDELAALREAAKSAGIPLAVYIRAAAIKAAREQLK